MLKLYLDNCCFNRPYDVQSVLLNLLESDAKLFVQKEILNGTFELVWSYMLDYENFYNPYDNRKVAIEKWKKVAKIDIEPTDDILKKAVEIMKIGIKNKDALHLSCAIEAKSDFFLTTDKKLLNKNLTEIKIINPIDFIKILEYENGHYIEN